MTAAENRSTAANLLRRHLSGKNPYLFRSLPSIRDAAELYVQLTACDSKYRATVGWAAYVCRATHRLHVDPQLRGHAAMLLKRVVHVRGRNATVNLEEIPAGRADPASHLAARHAVVHFLHRSGLCAAAARETVAALHQWMPHHHHAPDLSSTALVDALAMYDQCQRPRAGLIVLTAFAAALPEPGTEEHEVFVSYAARRLGGRHETLRHRLVCGIRPGRRQRSADAEVRSVLARLITGDGSAVSEGLG